MLNLPPPSENNFENYEDTHYPAAFISKGGEFFRYSHTNPSYLRWDSLQAYLSGAPNSHNLPKHTANNLFSRTLTDSERQAVECKAPLPQLPKIGYNPFEFYGNE